MPGVITQMVGSLLGHLLPPMDCEVFRKRCLVHLAHLWLRRLLRICEVGSQETSVEKASEYEYERNVGEKVGAVEVNIYAEENKERGVNCQDYALEDWLIWSVGGTVWVRTGGVEHEVTGNAHEKVMFVGWVHYLRHTRYPCTMIHSILFIKVGRKKKDQWNKTFSYLGMSNSLNNETLMFHAIGVPLNHVITASKESKLWSCPSSSGGPAAFYLTDIFSYLLHTTFPAILISTYWYLSSKRQLTGRNSALWSNNSHTREEGK